MPASLQIVSGLLLSLWFGAAMMSPMMFTSPEVSNDRKVVFTMLAVIGFPITLGLICFAADWTLFGLRPSVVLFLCSVPPLLWMSLLGLPRTAYDLLRGVNPYGYTKTQAVVYLHGRPIADAHPDSFEAYPDCMHTYARDRSAVYFEHDRVEGADPDSFQPVDSASPGAYWRDAQRVFYAGRWLEGADPKSFRAIGGLYAVDASRAYHAGEAISGAKVAKLRLYDSQVYARDDERIYYLGRPSFEGADVDSLEFLGSLSEFAKDRQRVYLSPGFGRHDAEVIEGADPASFVALGRCYAKDASRVYFLDGSRLRVIGGADPVTFEVTEYDVESESEARDRSRRYSRGRPR